MAKTTFTAFTGVKIFHQIEFSLNDRHKDHLSNTLAWLDYKRCLPAVPNGNHQLTLIIGVDKPHQIAKNYAVFMTQTGTWQDHRRQIRITDVDSQTGWQKCG